jgi:glycosyltransferase involved in cell wall biosynthesis
VIAGKTTAQSGPWLERMARPPLSHSVRYLGYVDPARRRELYEGAKLLVQPSFEEGFGLPVLEAMTVGVPVVAANRGALPEVLGDAGPLIDADNAAGFAEAIDTMVNDPVAAISATTRGLERARLFSWDRTALAMVSAYKAAMARRAERGAD